MPYTDITAYTSSRVMAIWGIYGIFLHICNHSQASLLLYGRAWQSNCQLINKSINKHIIYQQLLHKWQF
jgi:hypothetical protein